MSNLIELADRVAGLSGPCRETDCAIFCATAPSPFVSYYPDCVLASQGGFAARVEINEIATYTASLDAAMTLVPEGLSRLVRDGSKHDGNGDNRPYANIGHETGESYAATMALALCAAALRARAQAQSCPAK